MNLTTLDRQLACRHRSLRTLPGKLLLGSTGARLYADYLDEVPGFVGRLDFIHKLNLPGLFQLSWSVKGALAADTVWHPNYSEADYQIGSIDLTEEKFITWDDCAVCRVRWTNKGETSETLTIAPCDGWNVESRQGNLYLQRGCHTHGFQMRAVMAASIALDRETVLEMPPGESGSLVIVVSVGEACTDSWEVLKARVLSDGNTPEIRPDLYKEECRRWYEPVPDFSCDDPFLEKVWAYRWFLVRHNYAVPGRGNLRHGVFYEGRSHKLAKDEDHITGHEFAQLIPLSSPLHLMDARWKPDVHECRETVQSLLDNTGEHGLFVTTRIDEHGKAYGNFAAWAVWQVMLVSPDPEFVRKVLPGLKRYVRGIGEADCQADDVLPVCANHRLTGKEYQPSFWYFMGYPEYVNGSSRFQPVKRVDLAVYYYLNALGTAELCCMSGDPEEQEFRNLAVRICNAVLTRMWDEESGFFYDLHSDTDEKAMVKCVTGIYPLWADMPGVDVQRLLKSFLAKDTFVLGSGFASAEKNCPVFSAQGGWNKLFFKGRNGCIWNGPSWPYTTCIALDVLAKAAKAGYDCREAFARILHEYVLEHFRFGDIGQPYLVEHYDSITGEMLSDEPDYFHSFLIDLIVCHVAGICPEEGGIRITPVDIGLTQFHMNGIYVEGHRIDVSWEQGSYRVYVDGTCVWESQSLWTGGKGEAQYGISIRF